MADEEIGQFVALLKIPQQVDDLGPVHAAMELEYDGLAASPRFRTRVDLGDTAGPANFTITLDVTVN